ncbi:MAG: PD-(D/E)XK nuclease family protein, partial [Nitrospira sp.]
CGIADLLTLSVTCCEIRDFKTGVPKQEHEFQLRTYALLWAQDKDLNPSGRFADKLILSYEEGDVEVPAPIPHELISLEDELKERTSAALADIQTDPPEARPSPENCGYCPVRHLCEEYWQWHASQGADRESPKGQFADLQIKLADRHGPSSWDGVVESSPDLKACGPILLRTANLRLDLHPGQRLRLLNVHISMPDEESIEDSHPYILTIMGATSEAFVLST